MRSTGDRPGVIGTVLIDQRQYPARRDPDGTVWATPNADLGDWYKITAQGVVGTFEEATPMTEPTPGLVTDETGRCTIPPYGWTCSEMPGHDGPCAVTPKVVDEALVSEIGDALWRIEGNYVRETSRSGSRFEGQTLEAVQARFVIRRVGELIAGNIAAAAERKARRECAARVEAVLMGNFDGELRDALWKLTHEWESSP